MGIGAKPYDILVCESVAGEAGEGSGNSDYRAGYERGEPPRCEACEVLGGS